MTAVDPRPPLTHSLAFWRAKVVVLCETQQSLRPHLITVSRRCEKLAAELGLASSEVEMAGAAGLVHDIGKVPELARSGWHPVDGAVFLRRNGEERLARLTAHHTGAYYEAMILGHDRALEAFPEDRSLVSDILAFCDITTQQDGTVVDLDDLIAGVTARYGKDAAPVRALKAYWPDLLDAVDRIEYRRSQR